MSSKTVQSGQVNSFNYSNILNEKKNERDKIQTTLFFMVMIHKKGERNSRITYKRFSQTIVLPPCAGSYMSSPSTAARPNDD